MEYQLHLGGMRKIIKIDSRSAGRVVMERPFDSERGSGKFLVSGKALGVGLKMSVLTFDFSELEIAENEVTVHQLLTNVSVRFFILVHIS